MLDFGPGYIPSELIAELLGELTERVDGLREKTIEPHFVSNPLVIF